MVTIHLIYYSSPLVFVVAKKHTNKTAKWLLGYSSDDVFLYCLDRVFIGQFRDMLDEYAPSTTRGSFAPAPILEDILRQYTLTRSSQGSSLAYLTHRLDGSRFISNGVSKPSNVSCLWLLYRIIVQAISMQRY